MCNIIILEPNQMPIKSEFETMCWNNWHAFGLVTFVDGKLDTVKKAFTDKDPMNPEAIWSLLKRDVKYRRVLHVRHMTAGNNLVENAHPYDVYYSDKRDVKFMHNGTLYQYKSKKPSETNMNMFVDDDSGPSDSKNFVDRILTPYLSVMDAGEGKGDITNKLFLDLLDQFWAVPSSNRGILLSSDQGYRTVGVWKKRKDDVGGEYITANDDYFDKVSRGPEYTRREESRKAEEAKKYNPQTAKSHSTGTNIVPITPMANFPNLGKPIYGFFTVNDKFKDLLKDWSIYDREHAVSLAALTKEELLEIVNGDKQDLIFLMDMILTDYAQCYADLLEVEAKHDKASKKIAELKLELKDAA